MFARVRGLQDRCAKGSHSRRLLGKMLQGGTLRMIAGQAVVDGALDAVAQAALRNSLD
jgi:hypothetical protein